MRKSLVPPTLLSMCVLLVGAAQAQQDLFPERSFSTPEAAIRHFVTGMAANDLNEALTACSVNEQAARYDFNRETRDLQAILPWQALAPASSPANIQLNRWLLVGTYAQQMKLFAYSFLSAENHDFQPIANPGNQRTADFIKAASLGNLRTLSLVQVAAIGSQPKVMSTFARQAARNGADEKVERVVLYELGGTNYLGGFTLLRYGTSWHISGLYSALAGTPSSGAVQRITPDQFQALVAQYR